MSKHERDVEAERSFGERLLGADYATRPLNPGHHGLRSRRAAADGKEAVGKEEKKDSVAAA